MFLIIGLPIGRWQSVKISTYYVFSQGEWLVSSHWCVWHQDKYGRCSIENEFTERDQRRVLIFHVTWELMVGIMQSSPLTWGIIVVLWLSPWSLIMSKSLHQEGVHGIVGVKPLSYGDKWMRNKGSLTFKPFEGEYSMIWFESLARVWMRLGNAFQITFKEII